MKLPLAILFIMLPLLTWSQTFYVSSKDPKSKDIVEKKITFDGHTLSDSARADYVLLLLLDGHYSLVKMSYKGYIKIVNNRTGKEVGRTKIVKRNPAALNGYNASFDIFRIIAKRYLPAELKKCI